ncbi:MAG TPA: response regulator [Paraburkholderia sp.]
MPLFSPTARWTPRTLPQQNRRRRLLVVDDCMPGAEAIVASLCVSGYDAHFVISGQAVICVLNAWIPEIAVVDINMPGMDGFAVARQLRQDRRMETIAIVAFTAQDESAIRAEGIAAGFDGYCQKGSAPDSLLRLLEQIAGTTG